MRERISLRVTMGAMIDFKHETGKDVNEIGADIEQLTMFMYCCVRSACRADKVDFQLTFEQFADGINLDDFTSFQNGMAMEENGAKKKEGGESVTIESLLGLAMGCVGMCLNDFCRLTPLEFTAVFEAWQQKETYAERRQWKQSRFLACSILKPYSKKGLELTDVCRFSWDVQPAKEAEEEPSTQERFDEIKALWNGA